MPDIFAGSDANVLNILENLANVAADNLPELDLVAADVTPLATKNTTLGNSIIEHLTAQNTAKGAREQKDFNRGAAVSAARALVKKINANPNVPALLRQQLGLPPKDTTRSKPAVPSVAPAPVVEKVGGAQVVLKALNPETDSIAKPEGVKTIRIYEKIVGHNEAAPSGVDQMSLADVVTAGRITRAYNSADLCKTAYLALQYVNSAGEAGPVSVIVPASIAA
ncbi:MAG: hypothetical protein QOF78_3974 [Phycisphaerales bacterium]|jgi:hypothetical protein|nr:hypothetical protein [Phycisphaerales bacterium]